MKNKITNILCVISAIFFLWIFASFIDISAHNNTENPVYNDYNFFIILGGNENG